MIVDQKALLESAKNEDNYQKRRQWRVFLFFLFLFALSIALESHTLDVNLEDVSTGVRGSVNAFINPDKRGPVVNKANGVLSLIVVLRNMIPPSLMLVLVLWFGARFMHALYDMPSVNQANEYLRLCLFGPMGSGPSLPASLAMDLAMEELVGEALMRGPYIIVREGKVVFVTASKQVERVGGPGSIVVYKDSAVLLERAGRLTRIVGPGFTPLVRFEKIRDIITLRPRKYATFKDHETFRVGGMSREGIPVVWPVDIYYQINDEGENPHPATAAKPYAFSDEAVLKASTDRWLRGSDGHDHLEWGDRIAVSDVEGGLRSIMARLPLDRLIRPLNDELFLPRKEIQQELEDGLKKGAAKHGAKILKVDLHDIELRDPVAQQWIKTWQARWKKLADEELAEAEAERVYQLERVKAEAQEMLLSIREGLKKLDTEQQAIFSDIVSMRLIETLQRVAAHPRAISFADDLSETFATWDALRNLIESSVDSIDSGSSG